MSDRAIREAVRHLAGTHGKDEVFLVQCEVNSVNEAARTCDVTTISGRSQYSIDDVALMPIVDDGVLIIPTVGSTVLVIHNNRNVKFIAQFSEIDKIFIVSGSSTLEIKDGSIKFNDGSFDGLVKIKDLVTKLNNLENDINNLKLAFSSWTVVPTDGGAALKASAASWYGQQLTKTQQSDLENTKVTHGK
jgi:hypothetical protein